jgi:hypothetical protein
MMAQRRVEEEIKPGEWHDVLWHQYMNCVDSLRMQNAVSASEEGTQAFMSHPSWEGFEGNVRILEAMCLGYDIVDDSFVKKHMEEKSVVVFGSLTRILKSKEFWREARPYLGKV